MPKTVRVEGFPATCSKVKAELSLKKTARDRRATLLDLHYHGTHANLVFAEDGDVERFAGSPVKFSFGGKAHDLKTFALIGQQDTSPDERLDTEKASSSFSPPSCPSSPSMPYRDGSETESASSNFSPSFSSSPSMLYKDALETEMDSSSFSPAPLSSSPSMPSFYQEQYVEEFFDCNQTEDLEPQPPPPAVVEFSRAHTWFDLENFPSEQNQSALLVQVNNVNIGHQELIQYFEKKSIGGPIERMILMVDGVLMIFHRPKTAEEIVNKKTIHQIEGKQIKLILKIIPELYRDRLILKNDGDPLPDEEMKMDVTNLSPGDIEPDKIEQTDIENVSIVSYKEPLDEENFCGLMRKAKEREFDEASKILPVPKTDCIIIRGYKEGKEFPLRRLQIRLENKAFSNGATVTRMDRSENGDVLAYFASFRHAEYVVEKHGKVKMEDLNCDLCIEQYFHCFSNAHKELEKEHTLDAYSKMLFDREIAPMSFEYSEVQDDVLEFLATRRRHLEKLREDLVNVANVVVLQDAEKYSLKVSPVSVEVAKDQIEFKELCMAALKKFFAQFSSKTHDTFNIGNLEKVRQAKVHQNLQASGVDNCENDHCIRWTGDKNEILLVTGVTSELEPIIKSIISLTDISNESLVLTKGKYWWAVDSGVLDKLIKSNASIVIKRDDANHTLNFMGTKTSNAEAHLEILKSVEPIKDERFDSLEDEKNKFLARPGREKRVILYVESKLSNLKATLTIEKGIPYLWCHENEINKAVITLRKLLVIDKTMQLSSAESDATKLQQWTTEHKQLQITYLVDIRIENITIVILGFQDHVDVVKEKIRGFLDEHSIRKVTFEICYGKADFIVKHCNEFLNCKDLSLMQYGVDFGPPCAIFLRGKKNQVEKVMEILKKLDVLEEKQSWKNFGIFNYCTAGEGKSFIDKSADKCIILTEGSFPDDNVDSMVDTPEQDIDVGWQSIDSDIEIDELPTQKLNQPNKKQLSWTVCKGDITMNQSDAIVNCIGDKFSLKNGGLVCGAILSKGGVAIQSELDQSNDSDVRVTSSGNLPSKFIVHAHFTNDLATIQQRLKSVLQKADEKKCQSLAIPAIGTGNMHMAVEKIANLMHDVFEEFNSVAELRCLRQINVVIFDEKLLPVFKKVLDSPDKFFNQLHASSSVPAPKLKQKIKKRLHTNSGQSASHSVTMGPFTISIKKGDITEEKADAIVNSIGSSFNLSQGMVSKQIVLKGGEGIQKELTAFSGSEIRVTSAGKLPCKKIVHVVFPNTQDEMKKCIENILRKAEQEKCGSLSLPALGTGILALHSNAIAKLFKETLSNYSSNNPTSKYLKQINIVLFDEPKFADFLAEFITSQIVQPQPGAGNFSPPLGSPKLSRERLQKRPNQFDFLPFGRASVSSSDSVNIGPIKLTVKKGDITEEKTDAIVNSVGKDFDLTRGQVSMHIVRKGGDRIQKELSKMTDGSIRVTSAGNMQCKKILHAVFPNDHIQIKQSVKNVFCKAEEEKCATLSIPAIGTGNMQIASGEIAKQIRQAVNEFAANNPKYLNEINVVIFDESKFSDFLKEMITGSVDTGKRKRENMKMNYKSYKSWRATRESILAQMKEATKFDEERRGYANPEKFTGTSSNSVQMGPIHVTVRKGDITDEKADAIVNSTGTSFDLSGGLVSLHIAKKGGDTIQKELSAASGIDMRVTSGGKLSCKKIIHAVSPDAIEKVTKCAKGILQRAEAENCTSLSIPAIGTGNRNMASDVIAKVLIQGLVDFVAENPSTKHLKAVNIVIFDEQKYPTFLQALIDASPTSKEKPTSSKRACISKKPKDPDSITLFFYSGKKKYIDKAVKAIGDQFKSVFGEKTITVKNFHDVVLWKSDALNKVLSNGNVEYKIDKKSGKITLAGQNINITVTEHKVQGLSNEVRSTAHSQSLSLYSWKYCDSKDRWIALGPYENRAIEDAHTNKKQKCEDIQLQIDGKTIPCTVDIVNMKATPKSPANTFEFRIRRDVKEEYPRHWDDMGENELYKQVKLDSSSPEYKGIEKKLRLTVPTCTIHSICRIQNKRLFSRYQQEKRRVEKIISSGQQVERDLFHGTSTEIGDKIANEGFDRGYAGANATAYGNGVYFAKNASYSNQPKYAKPNDQGVKTILVAHVITGDFCVGKEGMKSAPAKPNSVELYNCAANNMNDPVIFVVFIDAGSYPEYMIKYTG